MAPFIDTDDRDKNNLGESHAGGVPRNENKRNDRVGKYFTDDLFTHFLL